MQHYVELTDMVHQAIKVEQQLKRRNFARRGPNLANNNAWKSNARREEHPPAKPKFDPSPKDVKSASTSKQGANEPTTRNRDIKCYKCQGRGHIASECPNRRVMIINAHGEIESENEHEEEEDEMPPIEEENGECAVVGDTLLTRRTLGVQPREEANNQRENLFHTRSLLIIKCVV